MKLSHKRLHIVEDDVRNRVIYQVTLLKHGAELFFDNHGTGTIQRLKQAPFRPDLIILDVMLGAHATGFDIAMQIRQLPRYTNIPIVAVSATEPIAGMAKAQRLGLNGFIAKPIDSHQFVDQVLTLCSGGSVWAPGDRFLTTG